ncbi:hypothetical protein [Terribacillus sp. JSM ZJ617]|uniref:hypothetical protein n=1 Tax=Terribacillus sp. JSM ZJ617 TaxID=3342119 RepID=UPI0035A85949
MSNVVEFNSFDTSSNELWKKFGERKNFEVSLYHHNRDSEPHIHINDRPSSIEIDHDDEDGTIIVLNYKSLSFTWYEKNHHTNLSNGAVVFSSKHDSDTYWIIDFH